MDTTQVTLTDTLTRRTDIMIKTTFRDAEYAVEEAVFRADSENCPMVIVPHVEGYGVKPLRKKREKELAVEVVYNS